MIVWCSSKAPGNITASDGRSSDGLAEKATLANLLALDVLVTARRRLLVLDRAVRRREFLKGLAINQSANCWRGDVSNVRRTDTSRA